MRRRCLRGHRSEFSISLNARSTAMVLLLAPVASMTLSSKASSMCIVIFMASKVWHPYHTVHYFEASSFELSRFPGRKDGENNGVRRLQLQPGDHLMECGAWDWRNRKLASMASKTSPAHSSSSTTRSTSVASPFALKISGKSSTPRPSAVIGSP